MKWLLIIMHLTLDTGFDPDAWVPIGSIAIPFETESLCESAKTELKTNTNLGQTKFRCEEFAVSATPTLEWELVIGYRKADHGASIWVPTHSERYQFETEALCEAALADFASQSSMYQTKLNCVPATTAASQGGGVPPPIAFYVDEAGSGTACTVLSPCLWSYAKTQAVAGDLIGFLAGTYPGFEIDIGGEVDSPITLLPVVANTVDITGEAPGWSDCVVLDWNSHLVFKGFKVHDCDRAGIAVNGRPVASGGPSTDLVITEVEVWNTGQGCISVGGHWPFSNTYPGEIRTDDAKVTYSLVYDCNMPNGSNESINAANGVANLEVAHNTVGVGTVYQDPCIDTDECERQYGIDFKQGVRDSSIHHNIIRWHERHCIYFDSGNGNGFVENIDVYSNICHSNRSGVAMAREEPTTQGIKNIHVFGNQLCNNYKFGILVYKHFDDDLSGVIEGILIQGNIIQATGADPSFTGKTVEVSVADAVVAANDNFFWNPQETVVHNPAGTLTQSGNVTGDADPDFDCMDLDWAN